MQVRVLATSTTPEGKVWGLDLTAESSLEDKILQRFWDGGIFGIKINGITARAVGRTLQLTFADQIDVKEDPELIGQWKEAK